MAAVTAGTPSLSPITQSTTAPSMVPSMMRSSRDMPPISASFALAARGASGVSVTSGRHTCAPRRGLPVTHQRRQAALAHRHRMPSTVLSTTRPARTTPRRPACFTFAPRGASGACTASGRSARAGRPGEPLQCVGPRLTNAPAGRNARPITVTHGHTNGSSPGAPSGGARARASTQVPRPCAVRTQLGGQLGCAHTRGGRGSAAEPG